MARHIKGRIVDASKFSLGIVVSRFNEALTERLLEGALETFERHGGERGRCTVVWVPGAFEIPVAARRLATRLKPDGMVCLGVVIRGATAHFDYVAGEAAAGISRLAQEREIPVGLGLLTTDTIEQAWERTGVKLGNKGAEATLAVLETIDCLARIDAAAT